MPGLRAIEDLGELRGRRVFVRVDFNVPLENGRVSDDSRIRAALPTIARLTEAGSALVLASHLGRPKGVFRHDLRLTPVLGRLAQLLAGTQVMGVAGPRDEQTQKAVELMVPGDITLLENLRFDPGEEANDPSFADALASLADLYVNDAFGAAHRAHASVVGVPERIPGAAGLLMHREVEVLGRLLAEPERPFLAILGGAKVSDKLPVVRSLLDRVDGLLVGGAMAFTFIAAQGGEVGDSLVEEEQLDAVRTTLKHADERGVPIALPEDVVAAQDAEASALTRTVAAAHVPKGFKGLDIGPATVSAFTATLAGARTVLWNGPMGVFELEPFAAGTRGIAKAVAGLDAFTVVGGGDSVAAIRGLGLEDAIDHLSTGGGASLELLEGKELPGVAVLKADQAGPR